MQATLWKDVQDCDISWKVSELPKEILQIAGQPSQAGLKEEPLEPSQYPKTADIEWEQLAKGHYVLAIGVDIGTTNCSACWDVVPRDQKLGLDFWLNFRHIQGPNGWHIQTQVANNMKDGQHEFIFSQIEIKNKLSEGLESEDIFTLLNLMLANAEDQYNDVEKKLVTAMQLKNKLTLEKYLLKDQVSPNIRNVLDIFREFLRHFWKMIRTEIASRDPLSEEVLEYALHKHTRIVVAVPAIWSSAMNNHFRSLLLEAGFPCAHIRSEPKLAAAAVVWEQQQKRNSSFYSKGVPEQAERRLWEFVCIVVDIGGCTTDLNSIQVTQTSPVLKCRTLMVGIGSMSGNELLNRLFSNRLSSILYGYLDRIITHVSMSPIEVLQSFMRGFERAKRTFNVTTTKPVKIKFKQDGDPETRLPTIAAINMEPLFIRLPARRINAVFDKYLAIIKPLLDQQIQGLDDPKFSHITRKSIFLVGGGSLIPYIKETLISEYTKPGQEIVHGERDDCSLVVKGAVLAAIDPALGLREFCHTIYGVLFSVPYNKDNPQHVADKHLCVQTS